jgi:hypothetical protein
LPKRFIKAEIYFNLHSASDNFPDHASQMQVLFSFFKHACSLCTQKQNNSEALNEVSGRLMNGGGCGGRLSKEIIIILFCAWINEDSSKTRSVFDVQLALPSRRSTSSPTFHGLLNFLSDDDDDPFKPFRFL